ncbi:ATP-binding protein [Mycolicibacterium frederiksbergense]|uniref:ATP-binding protein n=1 Tax=Mycolicibacterium frederiksbergense TaxID=117567 RepID=UPI0021F2DB71|nr:ATP-binding protein [Mycolicibacterium frederiksbergense]
MIARLRSVGDDTADVEAKKCGADTVPKSCRETLSAFANTRGGVLLLGVDQEADFTVSGVSNPAKIMSDLASMAAQMVPPLRPHIESVNYEGVEVITCEISELPTNEKPCHYGPSGMAASSYIRVHDADQKLTQYEIQLLLANRSQPRDDEEVLDGATRADLDNELLAAYLKRVRTHRPYAFAGLSDEQALQRVRIMQPDSTGELRPTVAALLAMGSYPQQFFPQLNITFVHYPTPQGDDFATGARFIDNVALDGPIPVMIRDAVQVLRRNMARRSTISGSGRADSWEYPETALREAIANACIHRDLSPYARGAQVQIEMFPDRLVVRNPGGLYGPVTEQSLGEEGISSSRNATLLKILEDVPIPGEDRSVCENRGSGIRAMINALRSANMSLPNFRNRISTFEVIFPNHSLLDDDMVAWIAGLRIPELTSSQCVALAALRRGTELNNESYRTLTGVDSRVATTELQALVGQELIVQSGSRRWATYRIATRLVEGSQGTRRQPADRRDAILQALGENELSRREIELLTGLAAQVVRHWLKRLRQDGRVELAGDAKPQSKNVKYRRAAEARHDHDPRQTTLDF